jgi:signal transduction histidine kinase
VTRLLESAALEDQDFTLDREAVDVQRLAQAVVEQNRRQAERKDQRIALDLPVGEACTVEADPTWIQEAMDNLVSNAVKYSPHGKPIRVAVTTSEVDIRFAVEDEGPGLTEEDKEKLFGKFERLSAAPTGDESSTGLGLSIVKQIIEKHDGRVWAESTHGEGSTFFIALPRSPADVQRG